MRVDRAVELEDEDALIGLLQVVSLELAAIAADHPCAADRIRGCREKLTQVVVGMQAQALLHEGLNEAEAGGGSEEAEPQVPGNYLG